MENLNRNKTYKQRQRDTYGEVAKLDPYRQVYIPPQYHISDNYEVQKDAEDKDEFVHLRKVIGRQSEQIKNLQMLLCKSDATPQREKSEIPTNLGDEAPKYETTLSSEKVLDKSSESSAGHGSDIAVFSPVSSPGSANRNAELERNSTFLTNTVMSYILLMIYNFQTSGNKRISQQANYLRQKMREVQDLGFSNDRVIGFLSEILDSLAYLHIQQSALLNDKLELNRSIQKFEDTYINSPLKMEECKASGQTGAGHYQCRVPHINWEVPVKLETNEPPEEKARDTEWNVRFSKGQHNKLDNKIAYSGPKYNSNNRGILGKREHRDLNGSGSYR